MTALIIYRYAVYIRPPMLTFGHLKAQITDSIFIDDT